MGLLGPSKRERQAAAKAEATANSQESLAKEFRERAAQIRKAETHALYPDPAGTAAVLRQLDANQRIAERNARDLRSR